jgi:hypothetical protein
VGVAQGGWVENNSGVEAAAAAPRARARLRDADPPPPAARPHLMLAPPREVPRMVPPCSWMPSTLFLVSTMGLCCLS